MVTFPVTQASTKALDRISGVYREEASRVGADGMLKGDRTGGGAEHRRKARSMSDYVGVNDEAEELPSVSALARFAIERERLAREMGIDELGGPATLGVVNIVGAHSHSHRKTGTKKRAPPGRGCSNGDSSAGAGGIHKEEGFSMGDGLGEGRSAGEILLEKLESVAEARSIEVMGWLFPRTCWFSTSPWLIGSFHGLDAVRTA